MEGDFVGILHSFMEFEKSMAVTIKGIQNVSREVSSAAEQVVASSNDLADGAANQAAVVEKLTATLREFQNRWSRIQRVPRKQRKSG
mgnify:CR=1 FL=1